MAKCKCPVCEQFFKSSEGMVKIGNRWYCEGDCAKQKQEENRESEHYRDLIQACCNEFGVSEPNPIWLAQIKNLREKHGLKSRGILLTLNYYYHTLGHSLGKEDTFLGIVVYYYSKAKEEYMVDMERRKRTKVFIENGSEFITREKVVIRPPIHKQEVVHSKLKVIDMGQFE